MEQAKNIIVTGCNKGLGFGMVQNLAKNQNFNIIMACRNLDKCNKAKDQILSKHPEAKLYPQKLDVADNKSVEDFVQKMKQKNVKIDILMNNAGISKPDVFDTIFKTNFYGVVNLTEGLLPLMKQNSKIINMSSGAGKSTFKNIKSQDLKKKLQNQRLPKDELFDMMKEFKQSIQDNTYEQKGWPKSIFGMSKLALTLYTTQLSHRKQIMSKGIQVYSCSPGYVKTDHNDGQGELSVQEGIKTPMYLMQMPNKMGKKQQGSFFEKSHLSSMCQNVM